MKSLFLFFLSLALAAVSPAQTNSDEAIALQFYPDRLVQDFAKYAEPGSELVRRFSVLRADLDGTGIPNYLVAAYTNGGHGAVRVIRTTSEGSFLVADPDLLTMGGIAPKIELFDLDADRRPEVIASFLQNRHSENWIFKWSDQKLAVFGPVSLDKYGNPISEIGDAQFLDLDADGVPEIIQAVYDASGQPAANPYVVYHLKDGKYAEEKDTIYYGLFVRQADKPAKFEQTFAVADINSPFTLRVINGDETGKNQVTAAEIRLNGVTVVTPDRFKQKARVSELPIKLQSQNHLQVELRSAPETELTLVVESRSPQAR